MGLDTTYDCWHGPYSSFARWRGRLAEVAGYAVHHDDGFPSLSIDWDAYPVETAQGILNTPQTNVLLVMLLHSDCDGYIITAHTTPLADRLTELLPRFKQDITGMRALTQQFIEGLRHAARDNADVRFY